MNTDKHQYDLFRIWVLLMFIQVINNCNFKNIYLKFIFIVMTIIHFSLMFIVINKEYKRNQEMKERLKECVPDNFIMKRIIRKNKRARKHYEIMKEIRNLRKYDTIHINHTVGAYDSFVGFTVKDRTDFDSYKDVLRFELSETVTIKELSIILEKLRTIRKENEVLKNDI